VSVRVDNAVLADEAMVSIVRGAVSQVEGVRLDRPGRVSRVLPGRRDAVSWELGERGAAFDVDVAAGYGVVLPRAAAEVRRSVADAVDDGAVASVDVTVTGVEPWQPRSGDGRRPSCHQRDRDGDFEPLYAPTRAQR
jgi:uncharacterized alkaline shock family protein YloU